MNKPTYEEIAKNFDLWGDYVDPLATMAKENFDSLSVEDKIKLIIDIFGEDGGNDHTTR